ncbi:MAG: folate-binding protein YgfZ [Rubrivivax sp.]|nr:folate-binding protein YgfZ [Rubrivivax sp.]
MSTPPAPAALPHGAVRLDDWGVIRAEGADAAHFLHGQLTQDVEHLSDNHARLAGYCSAKGRLLATFMVWREGPNTLFLACSADLLPAVLKRLSMFVLRASCKLIDVSAEKPLWGLAGGEALPQGAVGAITAVEASSRIALPPALVDGQAWPRALAVGAVPAGAAALDADAWRWLEVHSGVARVVAATAEQFVPQMVNLELVGGVSFKKGCYPGQEIVARSQYRGTLKRRAQVLASPVPLAPGAEVFHSADPGQPAGLVVLSGQFDGRHAALVEVKLAALESGTLHAGAPGGPTLIPAPLPYEIPAEAA